jgi:quercetin dioxygenase-like cupin family protein
METNAFEAGLTADGYVEIETKNLPPKPENGEHGHHYAVRGMVLGGTFIVREAGRVSTYRAGDVFAVAADILHTEETGADGARIVIGKKY